MKKQILLSVFAALVATGPLQANASILNAASRFMVTGAGIGGAGLYAAHNYPTTFDRVSGLLSRSAPQNPTVAPVDPNTMMIAQALQAQAEASKGPSLTREMAPFVLKGCAGLIVGFVVWDLTCGNGYTRTLITALEKKLNTFRKNTGKNLKLLSDKLQVLYRKLLKIEEQGKRTEQDIAQLQQQGKNSNYRLQTIESKVNALLHAQRTDNLEERHQILSDGLAVTTSLEDNMQQVAQEAQESNDQEAQEQNDHILMQTDIECDDDPEDIDTEQKQDNSGSLKSKISDGFAWASSWFRRS